MIKITKNKCSPDFYCDWQIYADGKPTQYFICKTDRKWGERQEFQLVQIEKEADFLATFKTVNGLMNIFSDLVNLKGSMK